MEPLTFEGSKITVGDRSWAVPYPVSDARRIGGRIIVIYKYWLGPKHRSLLSTQDSGPFHNVAAFDDAGRKLWTAENPTRRNGADAYVEFISEDPLILWNFACFRCTIDPATGKLLNAEFTK